MPKYFNTTAICRPKEHYIVDITEKLKQIKRMVDAGQYFTINRARQYGKTTTLRALQAFLKALIFRCLAQQIFLQKWLL